MNMMIVGKDTYGRDRKIQNETGNVYGRLTVIKLSKEYWDRGMYYWDCECSCGVVKSIIGTSLRKRNGTKSCGCYKMEMSKYGCHRLPENEAAKRRVIGRVKSSAMKRGLIFELLDDEILQLVSAPCHYCGALPYNLEKGANGEFKWNGIDQKIPCGGYTKENCVTCCMRCNSLKSDIPYLVFIKRCTRIADNLKKMR